MGVVAIATGDGAFQQLPDPLGVKSKWLPGFFCIHETTHTEGDQYGKYCQYAMAAYSMAVRGCMAFEVMEIKSRGWGRRENRK